MTLDAVSERLPMLPDRFAAIPAASGHLSAPVVLGDRRARGAYHGICFLQSISCKYFLTTRFRVKAIRTAGSTADRRPRAAIID